MKNSKSFKKSYVYVVAFLLVMLISFVYKTVMNMRANEMLIKKDSLESTNESVSAVSENSFYSECEESYVEETTINISVYVCGAVNSPGVYDIPQGSILNDAIMLAGGFAENAACDYVNLVYRIEDNISVYIPYEDEVSEFSGFGDSVIRGSGDLYIWGESVSNETSAGETEVNPNEGKVNINTASLEELMTLPGIGESTARAIIDYREGNEFITIEDIMNVSGIGEAKFNRIRDYICV